MNGYGFACKTLETKTGYTVEATLSKSGMEAIGFKLAEAESWPADERRGLLQDLRLAPAGIHPIFRELAQEEA